MSTIQHVFRSSRIKYDRANDHVIKRSSERSIGPAMERSSVIQCSSERAMELDGITPLADLCCRGEEMLFLVIRVESKAVTFLTKLWGDFQVNGSSSVSLAKVKKAQKRSYDAVYITEHDIGKGADGRKCIQQFYELEVPRKYNEVYEEDRY